MLYKKIFFMILITSFIPLFCVLLLFSEKPQKTPSFIIYEKSKAYKLFLKVYNSDGNEEFVDNYIRSYKLVSKMNPDIKFKFLLLVYLNCDLDAGDWLYFCNEIQDDNNFFWERLDNFIKSSNFKKLPLRLQKRVKDANESYLDDNQHFDVHL